MIANNDSDACEDLVRITIGSSEHTKTFQVYRGLLCFHAEHFKAIFDSEIASENLLIADLEVHVFQTFFYWINSGDLDFGETVMFRQWEMVMKIYAFADCYIVQAFGNAIPGHICSTSMATGKIPVPLNHSIYENTAKQGPLRRWLVDVCVAHMTITKFGGVEPKEYHSRFLFDFILAANAASRIPGVQTHDVKAWRASHLEHFCE